MTAAVELRDVFRVYQTAEGDAAALQGLSLTVDEGELLVVLGPSGSGKTTLLRVLAGLERPSAGRVVVAGHDLARLRRAQLALYRSHLLGYVEQHYWRSLDPHLTALELVSLQLGLIGRPRREREARARELLQRVGLAERENARPSELSGGEQQRVALCAAVAHRPALLLADEPTGELDAETASAVYALLAQLTREHGCTTIVVSHDPSSAAIANRTVRVRDGRVSEETPAGANGKATIVVGRGGWLRIPEELLGRAGITTRATASRAERAIVLEPPAHPAARGTRAAAQRAAAPRATAAAPRVPIGTVAELRAVTKTVGDGRTRVDILAGLDAVFEAGRLVAVTGPSGSGKTTLLHLLAGLTPPTRGEVLVLGTSITALSRGARAELRRRHVALVAQQLGLIPFLSARDNVALALALRSQADGAADERAEQALAAVGLAERTLQRVGRLSAGERQRVAVARAVVSGAKLILADEPTARLDESNSIAIALLLANLAATHGVAIICATHDSLVVEQAHSELPLTRASTAAAATITDE